MSTLEPRIEAIRKEYGLSQDDFWQIKQNKQWVCKHAALEVVAAKAGIEWLEPRIIEMNATGLVTSLIVTGKLGNRVEWSIGETNPTNYSVTGKQPAYPWAMSEKRGKDRVILKLSGVHGLLYSDAEMDAPSSHIDAQGEASEVVSDSTAKLVFPALQSELQGCATRSQLDGAWSRWLPVIVHWSESMQQNCEDVRQQMTDYLREHGGDAREANRDVIEADLRSALDIDDLKAKWSGWGPAMKKLAAADVAKLSEAKEQVKKAILNIGGKAPDFDHLDTSREAADPELAKAERLAAIARTP